MKKPFIWTVTKYEFHILWIWRFALVFASTFEDDKKFGFRKGKRGVLFWYKNYAFGLGHSFGAEVEAYKN